LAARGYNTAAYRRMKALLATNAIPCHWCSVARATQPDHLVPLALGGGDDDWCPVADRATPSEAHNWVLV
jgi:hypothetical protein